MFFIDQLFKFFEWLFSNDCPYCRIELETDIFGGMICPKCGYDGMTGKRLFS